jgi:hypothetical protein
MLRFFVIITEKLSEAQQERNALAPVLIATAREMTAGNFACSLTSSVNSACPGKGSDQGSDEGSERSRTSGSSRFPRPIPFSNRELSLLERELSRCKQRKATPSNRELSTIRNSVAPSRLMRDRTVVLSCGSRFADRGSRPPTTFAAAFAAPKDARPEKFSALPNLNRQIHEYRNAVTCRKQTATHCSNSQKFQKWMYVFSPPFPPAPISPRTNASTKTEL